MVDNSFSWKDKVVAITGGGNGIGLAIAIAAKNLGAKISISDINEKDLKKAKEENNFNTCLSDAGKEKDILNFISNTEENLGEIDIFFANAGVARSGTLSTSDEDWDISHRVNVMHHVWAARAVIPSMRKRSDCRFITTASAAGLLSEINSASYSLTKHAAVGFAEWLSIVYGKNDEDGNAVSISCLCPQGVKTAMTANMDDGGVASVVGIDGMLTPTEVAKVVIETVTQGEFLILPHPIVGEYIKGKTANYPRWLGGMRKLYSKFKGSY
jgi:NAD(P)-dependent dehydrogenase (short-subunit alcohol dehydrogenase family)